MTRSKSISEVTKTRKLKISTLSNVEEETRKPTYHHLPLIINSPKVINVS